MKAHEALKEMIENKQMIKRVKNKNSYSDLFYKVLKTDIGDLIVYRFGESGVWTIGTFSIEGKELNDEYEIVEKIKGEIK